MLVFGQRWRSDFLSENFSEKSRDQQTQPVNGVESGNQTQATRMEGKCAQNSNILALQNLSLPIYALSLSVPNRWMRLFRPSHLVDSELISMVFQGGFFNIVSVSKLAFAICFYCLNQNTHLTIPLRFAVLMQTNCGYMTILVYKSS